MSWNPVFSQSGHPHYIGLAIGLVAGLVYFFLYREEIEARNQAYQLKISGLLH